MISPLQPPDPGYVIGLGEVFDAVGWTARFRHDWEALAKAYARYLGDIDLRLVMVACLNVGAAARFLPTPQDIRLECGRIAGIGVTPSADRVWDELVNQALYERRVLNEGERGEGPELSPVGRRLYGMLGADDILNGGSVVRAHFRDFYGDISERYNEHVAGVSSPRLAAVDVDALAARGWTPQPEIGRG